MITRTIYLALCALILSTLFVQQGCVKTEGHSIIIVPISDNSTDRVFVDPYSDKLFETSFLFPVLLEVTDRGLFVLDVRNSSRIRWIDWNFQSRHDIGKGRGSGPGEVAGVSDIHVTGDTLFISDRGNGQLHLYTIENEYLESLSIEGELPVQITTIGERLVVSTESSERLLFVDRIRNMFYKSESVTTDDIRYRYVMEGRILADDEFVYRIPFYFSLLFRYSNEGHPISAINLIDNYGPLFDDRTSDPEQNPIMIDARTTDVFNFSGSIENGKICVLRDLRVEERRVIDCFLSKDSRYLYSFEPPENTRDFKLHDGFFAAIHDTTLSVWKWTEPSPH